jgi:hypothetical protein
MGRLVFHKNVNFVEGNSCHPKNLVNQIANQTEYISAWEQILYYEDLQLLNHQIVECRFTDAGRGQYSRGLIELYRVSEKECNLIDRSNCETKVRTA